MSDRPLNSKHPDAHRAAEFARELLAQRVFSDIDQYNTEAPAILNDIANAQPQPDIALMTLLAMTHMASVVIRVHADATDQTEEQVIDAVYQVMREQKRTF